MVNSRVISEAIEVSLDEKECNIDEQEDLSCCAKFCMRSEKLTLSCIYCTINSENNTNYNNFKKHDKCPLLTDCLSFSYFIICKLCCCHISKITGDIITLMTINQKPCVIIQEPQSLDNQFNAEI